MTESQEEVQYNTQVAVLLRAIRTGLGWTQQQLAEKAQVAKPTISRIEKMDIASRNDTVRAILNTFEKEGVVVTTLYEELTITFKKPALLEAQKNISETKE